MGRLSIQRKISSNKKLVSVASQTAAEIIYDRADSEKEFMGLTSFKGSDVTLEDVRIAKNYLSEKELKKLNALVSAFFDMAEYQAENHNEMHKSDYVEQLDRTIQSSPLKNLILFFSKDKNQIEKFPLSDFFSRLQSTLGDISFYFFLFSFIRVVIRFKFVTNITQAP